MKIALFTSLLFVSQLLYCQISGKIFDREGNPLSQVSVTVNDSITESNDDGSFELDSKLSRKIDISFFHPLRGAKILIKNFPTRKVRQIELEMPILLQYFGEITDKTEFTFIPCLCYTNQSYPYYKNKLDSNIISIKVNNDYYKFENYKYDPIQNLFIINWREK